MLDWVLLFLLGGIIVGKESIKFSVIGAGHGGQGFAGYLASLGYEVKLFNRTIDKIKSIRDTGYIQLEGNINAKGYISVVTDDIETAIKDTNIIMIVLPANAHKSMAYEMAPYLNKDQYVVLNPGRTGGALEFKNIIDKINPLLDITIIEAQTLLFACRSNDVGRVNIFSKKNIVKVAALPAERTLGFIDKINEAIPEFNPAINVLETSFNNFGAVLHPIPTILNSGRIENTSGNFQYYIDGITPSVAKVVEEVDKERISVARALGVNTISLKDWLKKAYSITGENLNEILINNKGYHGIMAPSTIETRYIFEDVPNGLVPISNVGKYLGIDTPTIDSVIHLASILHKIDYFAVGRKLEDMGIEGLTIDEIKDYINKGNLYEDKEVVA